MGLLSYLRNKFKKEEKVVETKEPLAEIKEEQIKEETVKPVEEEASTLKEEVKTEQIKEVKPVETEVKKEAEAKIAAEVKQEDSSNVVKQVYLEKPGVYKESDKDVYVRGLRKSNKGFMAKLRRLTSIFYKVDEEYFQDLEEILIEADVGVDLSLSLVDKAKKQAKIDRIEDPKEINDLLIDMMFEDYRASGVNKEDLELQFAKEGPTVLLVVGVNGVGKTTTIAKLAKRYIDRKKKVLLVAGDTFRAGASEQLEEWSRRLGCDIVKGNYGVDPSSLCYEGLNKAKSENYDLVIVDTAGRLQNKSNLMAELGKMSRVMKKIIPDAPHETFLIIDANTGQNGVEQAKVFKEVTPLSGIVITKMDGTSKGGIILAIRNQIGVPVRYIGLGEKFSDLKVFDLDSYLYGLLIGEEDEK